MDSRRASPQCGSTPVTSPADFVMGHPAPDGLAGGGLGAATPRAPAGEIASPLPRIVRRRAHPRTSEPASLMVATA